MGRISFRTGIFPTTHTWELDTTLIKVEFSCALFIEFILCNIYLFSVDNAIKYFSCNRKHQGRNR